MKRPSRGEIWTANLNPTHGHEQAGNRPVLILSTNTFNHGPADLIFVLPLTTTNRQIPFHLAVTPPEGGLKTTSYILCDAGRSISKQRLGESAWGRISTETMARVEYRMRTLLEL